MNIKVGESVPLILKVFDGNEKLDVKAILKNEFGEKLGEVNLLSTGNGRYSTMLYKMPDVRFLTAEYITDRPDDYEECMDTFKAIPKPQPEEKYLVGEVVDVIKLTSEDDVLIGEVV